MAFENIHNYYESLVVQHVHDYVTEHKVKHDENFLEDVACVALNNLPPRYVRYNIDLLFYLTKEERKNMFEQIEHAVQQAINYVTTHKK